ncbi:kinesin family member 22 [Pancytospora epiphaga]|nr:kinesin family member 22 [Pancytospora epiphaga]
MAHFQAKTIKFWELRGSLMILEEQNITSPITVIVRIRPSDENIEHTSNTLSLNDSKNQLVTFGFDHCFGPKSDTEELYKIIRSHIVVGQGENTSKAISILAYGHTGSGKTFTMCGGTSAPGLIHLVLEDSLSVSPVTVSFIEIYNEKVIDLLDRTEKRLTECREGFVVQGLVDREVKTQDEFVELFEKAIGNRKTGSTGLNKVSSRSHLIVKVQFGGRTISFVDLAGSENNRRTGNFGIRLEESSNINRSLFVLSNVINAIVHKEKRIPYRDSRLTRLLRDSIGGMGHCFLIATVVGGCEHLGEVMKTLGFAAKSRKVINKISFINNGKGPTDKAILLSKSASKSKSCVLGNDSSSFTRSSIEMTPITKQKSYECFLGKAKEYEESQDYRSALEMYRTVRRFASSEYIEKQIIELQTRLRKSKARFTEKRMLEILNTGSFLEIKKLSGVGDRRAQCIVDYVAKGNRFECLSDLKMVFSEKVVIAIVKYVDVNGTGG